MLNSIKAHLQVFLNQTLTIKKIVITFLLGSLLSCASLPYKSIRKEVLNDFQSENFKAQHTGFLIVDLEKKDTLVNYNGSKYFIPASTAKLFTLYTSLQFLNESMPSLKYFQEENGLTIIGTGDPTWLHPYFKNEAPIEFLKQNDTIRLFLDNYGGEKYGPGWAWEDYPYYFSPEMDPIPLFGNVVTLEINDSLKVTPTFFSKNVQRENSKSLRDWNKNNFYVTGVEQDTLYVPFITSRESTLQLLAEKTGKNIVPLDSLPLKDWKILPGIPRDSVLKQMLWESDNFLAEQLMLTSSSTLSDTLSFEKAKDFVLNNHFGGMKQKPRWVDGSGLSRYNLFTPESMVTVLQKLHSETDSTRLSTLMPQWNSEGTITQKNTKNESFILAKSGSMGNIYNLCGFLRTKSGRMLAFSFMNNHFRRPSEQVRQDMYKVLTLIHNSY